MNEAMSKGKRRNTNQRVDQTHTEQTWRSNSCLLAHFPHIYLKKKNPHHAHSSSKSKAQNRFPTKSINMSKCSLCMYACMHARACTHVRTWRERGKKNAQETSDRVMICRSPFTSVMNASAFFPSSCTHYALSHLML